MNQNYHLYPHGCISLQLVLCGLLIKQNCPSLCVADAEWNSQDAESFHSRPCLFDVCWRTLWAGVDALYVQTDLTQRIWQPSVSDSVTSTNINRVSPWNTVSSWRETQSTPRAPDYISIVWYTCCCHLDSSMVSSTSLPPDSIEWIFLLPFSRFHSLTPFFLSAIFPIPSQFSFPWCLILKPQAWDAEKKYCSNPADGWENEI